MRKVSLVEKNGYNLYYDHGGLEDIQKKALRKQNQIH